MGVTFKENVSDIRNSKVADVISELKSYGVNLDIVDPQANSDELQHEYGFSLVEKTADNYDAVIVAVNHKDYMQLKEEDFKKLMKGVENPILIDIKGIYRNKIKDIQYWSF
jgi:UDP-N-acetyl-D-glucosamine/UDP-N-acetyl-D-galactosamine dehydrogenase